MFYKNVLDRTNITKIKSPISTIKLTHRTASTLSSSNNDTKINNHIADQTIYSSSNDLRYWIQSRKKSNSFLILQSFNYGENLYRLTSKTN